MSWQILSASPGSLRRRYRVAFSSAAGMPSRDNGFSSNIDSCFRMPVCLRLGTKAAQQLRYWIEKFIHHALFQRDDGVVGDRDVFRTDMCAAFGDVAVADVEGFS